MKQSIRFFHWLSFLQFPMLIIAAYNFLSPFWQEDTAPLDSVTNALLWIGLAMSFSALADVPENSNWRRKLRDNSRMMKLWLFLMGFMILLIFVVAAVGLVYGHQETRNLWISLLVVGIGMLGLMRMSLDILR